VALFAAQSSAIATKPERHTAMAILPNLAQENEALKAMLDAKLAELQVTKDKLALASQPRGMTMKVTAKKINEKTGEITGTDGALSIYGLGRFPITMYRGQWERLLAGADDIKAFIAANAALLAVKA
jgi:hypothetical protein